MSPNSDYDILLKTLWAECRGEPLVGQIAVACVIRNRVNDKRWPNTFAEVCRQKWQFSCWNPGETPIVPQDGQLLERLRMIANGVMSGVIPDITNGANHYINAYAKPPEPDWAQKTASVVLWPSPLVGVHTFYKF